MRKCGHAKVVLIMFVFRAVGLTGVAVPAQREEQGLNTEEVEVWDLHG
jgi:hypothetical protein